MTVDAHRDATAFALALADDEPERAALILSPYTLGDDELHLLVALFSLVALDRDADELLELLVDAALIGAGREPWRPTA